MPLQFSVRFSPRLVKSKNPFARRRQPRLPPLRVQYATRIRHEGLVKADAGEKGFGVFATRPFRKGEFLVEYEGEVFVDTQDDENAEGIFLFKFQSGKLFYM
jgi:hypothetical protein